jgi:germination protein YpeB
LGDYAHSLTKRALAGEKIGEEDNATIQELRAACAKLAKQTGDRYLSGDLPLEALTLEGFFADSSQAGEDAQSSPGGAPSAEAPDADEGQAGTETSGDGTTTQETGTASGDSITQFPTLIYDGPFSESAEKAEAKGLTGGDVSEAQAKQVAEDVAGTTLQSAGVVNARIPAYSFRLGEGSADWVEAQISQKGGHLLWYMRPASGNKEGRPQDSEAKRYADTALKRLEELGYQGMIATYAQYYAGKALINCAATQNDVILYADLVKVWVDRETMEVIGIDARNYLFSHTARQLPQATLPIEEAEAILSPKLEIQNRALALIPITPETEKLCYEFKCTLGEDSYILYINVETGAEEQVYKIIDSEDGTLVL